MQNPQNETQQVVVTTDQQAYQISAWKAASIVAGAVIVSIVGTAFTVFSVLNSDHFLLLSATARLDAIEQTAVRRDVLLEQIAPMKEDISEMKADIKLLVREQQRGN